MRYQVIRQPLWIEGKDIQPGVKVLSGPFDLSQILSNVTPETARPSSDPCYNAQLIDLAETPESVLTEETPDMHITYCTTLAVESKLKKTSIPENVILGNVRDMTKDEIKTVNIEKIIVVPDELSEEVDYDLRNNEEPPSNTETVTPPELPTLKSAAIDPDLAKLAFAFGHYLNSLPGAKAYASEACKVVYQQIPDAQEILKRCGKLKGLISKCPYLSMSGGSHGGTYLLKLDKDMFATLVSEN